MENAADGSLHFAFGNPPRFWKGVGDEVLFQKTIRSPLDAVASIRALTKLVDDHRQQFQAKEPTKSLDVKATAWLAGFPINNSEVVFDDSATMPVMPGADEITENFRLLALLEKPNSPPTSYRLDFLGPSIDLGFRLRQFASQRKLVVSADLVWLLCRARSVCAEAQIARCALLDLPPIGFDGSTPLKGVLDSMGYPLFWIECTPPTEAESREENLVKRARLGHAELNEYCNQFLNGSHPVLMTPYIQHCHDSVVAKIHPGHQEMLDRLREHVRGSSAQIEDLMRNHDDAGNDALPDATTNFAEDIAQQKRAEDFLDNWVASNVQNVPWMEDVPAHVTVLTQKLKADAKAHDIDENRLLSLIGDFSDFLTDAYEQIHDSEAGLIKD